MDFRKHWKKLMGVTIGLGHTECATSAGAVAEYSLYYV